LPKAISLVLSGQISDTHSILYYQIVPRKKGHLFITEGVEATVFSILFIFAVIAETKIIFVSCISYITRILFIFSVVHIVETINKKN